MSIKKVWIEEGCTICNLCESICPDVFEMTDETSKVKDGADFIANESCIKESADSCPVSVIKYE